MPAFRTGTVTAILSERQGLQRVEVDGRRAYVLTQLVGPVAIGDRVVVNTTAVELGLGTGGWDVVHWNLERAEWAAPGPGHVMKLRYTSLQVDAGAAEEAPDYVPPGDLAGAPVVACGLHSQVACVAATVKHLAPDARVAYVMTDGGALPIALSDLVANLREAGLLDVTVTAGQAFGGELESVNLASGLEVAVGPGKADVVIAGTGPGVVGTATPRGFSALEIAGIVDAAALLGGHPIAAIRWSDADDRPRHRGISHHFLAALGHAHARATIGVPHGEPLPELGAHDVLHVEVPDVPGLLAAANVTVTTMGRTPADEPRFFAYAGAAGVAAASVLPTQR